MSLSTLTKHENVLNFWFHRTPCTCAISSSQSVRIDGPSEQIPALHDNAQSYSITPPALYSRYGSAIASSSLTAGHQNTLAVEAIT